MQKTIDLIKSRIEGRKLPEIGLILGSGLGHIAEEIDGVKIPYSELPGFKVSTVAGHEGRLVIGELCSKNVMAMQGRFHYYEGYPMSEVIYPIRVMKYLGINKLIITNAAGGINKDFNAGDLMIIEDHINFMGNNPLIGKNLDELGPRFIDMSYAYDSNMRNIADEVAKNLNIHIQKGVYAAVTGPSYETPAEIRMYRTLGADAIGMSTVPEVIAARHMGIKVLGISCISNLAAGILSQPLQHEDVIKTTNRTKHTFSNLVKGIIERL